MGTIIERSRKDGSKAFTAQIVIKKDGKIVHARLKPSTANRPPMPGLLSARPSSKLPAVSKGRKNLPSPLSSTATSQNQKM
jgi:hypothetical protein